jgi:hypothetical protein
MESIDAATTRQQCSKHMFAGRNKHAIVEELLKGDDFYLIYTKVIQRGTT